MPIYCIEGDFGEGKTLFMTWRGWLRYRRGHRIIANYGVKYPHEKLNAARLVKMDESLKDCVILGDEFHVILDSRLGMKGSNIAITYFILQTRKRGVHLFITTQDLGQVDKRLRQHLDYRVICARVGEHKFRYRIFKKTKAGYKYHKTVYLDGRKHYHLYDTTETITDFNIPTAVAA